MAKGYSRQRIIEQLNELSDILDARISMELIADKEWNPEENRTRPTVTENGIVFPSNHVCQSKCESCGRCTDTACTESACAKKCKGHSLNVSDRNNDEADEGNFTALIIVGVVAALVLIGTGVAMFLVIKKKNAEVTVIDESASEDSE